jgi:cell division protein FtsX
MVMHWAAVTAASGSLQAAREGKQPLVEFMRDPSLTVACVLLVVVSVGWVVVTRLIVHKMKRAAKRGARNAATEAIRPAKDIWTIPP